MKVIAAMGLTVMILTGCSHWDRLRDKGPCEAALKAATEARSNAITAEQIADAEGQRTEAMRKCNWLP